jgi:hypothetical protein
LRTWKSLIRRSVLDRRLARWLVLYPLFWVGYTVFAYTRRTPWISYFCFRELYGQTRGKLTKRLSATITHKHRPLHFLEPCGLLGSGVELEANLAASLAALETDGYFVFPMKLSAALCDELRDFARSLPAKLIPSPTDQIEQIPFDDRAPRAPKYDFEQQRVIANPVVQMLLADRTLLTLAYRYLKALPINDLVAMWWSAPFGSQASSEAAQLFHFDLDRIRFLKFFFYLTDVNSNNGPHMYIRSTHEAKPHCFFEDRRFLDDEIAAAFRPEAIVELVGPAGTIIAVDTMGLHKGKALTTGCRLILQFEFTNSLFGAPYERLSLPVALTEDLRQAVKELPVVFQRLESH